MVPVPSPDKWGGLVAGRASDHKTFARTNMASEDWPETSTPHNVGKDVEEEEVVDIQAYVSPKYHALVRATGNGCDVIATCHF